MLSDGKIIAAAQEERFTRLKHDASFPRLAIQYCLAEAGISSAEIDVVVFYEKPFLKFERLLESYLAFAPRGFTSFVKAMPLWVREKLFQKSHMVKELAALLGDDIDWSQRLRFSEHHLSHAASAFYPSPFENAAVLTLDAVGEWATTSAAVGRGNDLRIIKEIRFPHSLGLLYSAFTYYVGFKVNSGEYKLMGLAPYGEPKYADVIRDNLIDIAEDGSFRLNMDYFDYATGLKMTNRRFDQLFGGGERKSESVITQRHMDLAASIQTVTEEVIVKLARGIALETGEKNLCLAGGVALNCVANGTLLKEGIFDHVWIQPAAGDAGGALGAAMSIWHIDINAPRDLSGSSDSMQGALLGPEYSDDQIERELTACGASYTRCSADELIERVAEALVEQKAIGWMQGRLEFGPRALGARSIIADPRSPTMQRQLNLKIKYRESFRPFAPSVLSEDAHKWFDLIVQSPYMLIVAKLREEFRVAESSEEELGLETLHVPHSSVPAVTHVDYSARVQTVERERNERFHELLTKFKELTGCPMVVNTSFNVRGEPIVCSPTDAYNCFMGTELDVLAIGNYVLLKKEQSSSLKKDYRNRYALD